MSTPLRHLEREPAAVVVVGGGRARGFTLIELMVTLAVLTVLSLGVIPLVQTNIKRQREQRLREVLRQMRSAIDDFRRDTVGMQCGAAAGSGLPASGGVPPPPPAPGQGPGQPGAAPYIDPRSRVFISDCTIFGVDNPDHYPPDLETLVKGVSVSPRGMPVMGGGPNGPDPLKESSTLTKKKVYLREIPVDPMTGKAEWDLRSNYDPPDATSWGGENVFDVRSQSKATALNGEKYHDW